MLNFGSTYSSWRVMHHVLLIMHSLCMHTMADYVLTVTGGLRKPFTGLGVV